MEPEVIACLMDKDASPDVGPLPYSVPSDNRILGSGGIQVVQNFERSVTMVSMSPEIEDQIQTAITQPSGDPFANIAFRCSYNQEDQTVTVKPGFLSYTKWQNGAWVYQEFETLEETKAVAALPCYVYLVVPMRTNSSDIDDGTSPFGAFFGTAEIEGSTYATDITYTTDWTGPNESSLINLIDVVPVPYTLPSTDFRRIIATIDKDGNVDNRHFSGLTIPQSFSGRIITVSIV